MQHDAYLQEAFKLPNMNIYLWSSQSKINGVLHTLPSIFIKYYYRWFPIPVHILLEILHNLPYISSSEDIQWDLLENVPLASPSVKLIRPRYMFSGRCCLCVSAASRRQLSIFCASAKASMVQARSRCKVISLCFFFSWYRLSDSALLYHVS